MKLGKTGGMEEKGMLGGVGSELCVPVILGSRIKSQKSMIKELGGKDDE